MIQRYLITWITAPPLRAHVGEYYIKLVTYLLRGLILHTDLDVELQSNSSYELSACGQKLHTEQTMG